MKKISTKVAVDKSLEKAVNLLKNKAKEKGFGTLTDIDLQEKFKEKLDLGYTKYRILGVCNPDFAHKVIDRNKSIGLFLPCTIIVYEQEGQTYIELQKPTFISKFFDDEEISRVAEMVEAIITEVINSIK